jgi:hypothetical protein
MSLDQIYAQAVVIEPIFRVRVQRLAAMCSGYFPVTSDDIGGAQELKLWSDIEKDTVMLSRVFWPEIKNLNRSLHKVDLYYNGKMSKLI